MAIDLTARFHDSREFRKRLGQVQMVEHARAQARIDTRIRKAGVLAVALEKSRPIRVGAFGSFRDRDGADVDSDRQFRPRVDREFCEDPVPACVV